MTKNRQIETQIPKQRAVLVGIQLPGISEMEVKASVAELERLVTTLGYDVIGELYQKRNSDREATVLGDGKLAELAEWTGGTGKVSPTFVKKLHRAALKFKKNQSEEETSVPADLNENEPVKEGPKADVVVFDCDLSPSQLRNVESATGAPVLDRTGVIIEIISRHAKTRTAKAQVEIARLSYVAPRLRETGGGDDQQGGGGAGAGETSLELDKRKIRDRIKELKDELAALGDEQEVRRQRRNQEATVALVGYTNAGKSSLMRALTGSEVLVANKLFATLDTTVRILHPESIPRILVSDTVGFIKKLPHDLVASFKSTLDEAAHASLLLYVVDSSDETFESQLEVTRTVLSEVGASELPSLLIMNKSDRLSAERRQILQAQYPEAVFLSAHNADDVSMLRQKLIDFFSAGMIETDVLIPYHIKGAIGEIRSFARVVSESYKNEGILFRVATFQADLEKFKSRHGL